MRMSFPSTLPKTLDEANHVLQSLKIRLHAWWHYVSVVSSLLRLRCITK